jgi:OOP family OmpA-OmpF porin
MAPSNLRLCALAGALLLCGAVAHAGQAPQHVPAASEADSDGDGVPDSRDVCPDTPRGVRVDSHGCPCEVTAHVEFMSGSARLTEDDKIRLDRVIGDLHRLPWVKGVIEGHTDNVGNAQQNYKLSLRRAAAVRAYLTEEGVATSRITVVGRGASRPLADNRTPAGRAQNRRAVLRRTDCS